MRLRVLLVFAFEGSTFEERNKGLGFRDGLGPRGSFRVLGLGCASGVDWSSSNPKGLDSKSTCSSKRHKYHSRTIVLSAKGVCVCV